MKYGVGVEVYARVGVRDGIQTKFGVRGSVGFRVGVTLMLRVQLKVNGLGLCFLFKPCRPTRGHAYGLLVEYVK